MECGRSVEVVKERVKRKWKRVWRERRSKKEVKTQ